MPIYGSILIFLVGLYGIITKPHLIKKLISLAILNSGVILFFIATAYRLGGTAPITGIDVKRMVDPVPHALMLTAIVIGISSLAVGLSLAVKVYQQEKTMDTERFEEEV